MQNHPNQDADYDTVRAAMQANDEYINVNYPFVQGLVRKGHATATELLGGNASGSQHFNDGVPAHVLQQYYTHLQSQTPADYNAALLQENQTLGAFPDNNDPRVDWEDDFNHFQGQRPQFARYALPFYLAHQMKLQNATPVVDNNSARQGMRMGNTRNRYPIYPKKGQFVQPLHPSEIAGMQRGPDGQKQCEEKRCIACVRGGGSGRCKNCVRKGSRSRLCREHLTQLFRFVDNAYSGTLVTLNNPTVPGNFPLLDSGDKTDKICDAFVEEFSRLFSSRTNQYNAANFEMAKTSGNARAQARSNELQVRNEPGLIHVLHRAPHAAGGGGGDGGGGGGGGGGDGDIVLTDMPLSSQPPHTTDNCYTRCVTVVCGVGRL